MNERGSVSISIDGARTVRSGTFGEDFSVGADLAVAFCAMQHDMPRPLDDVCDFVTGALDGLLDADECRGNIRRRVSALRHAAYALSMELVPTEKAEH